MATTGTKTFRCAFRFGGKEKLLVLGRVADVSLSDARARHDDIRQQLRRGEDPSGGRWAQPAAANDDAVTFEAMARAWLAHQVDDWSPVHAVDVRTSLELHVFPAIGAKPLADIDAPTILRVLRQVEESGSIETARRIRQRISAVFSRAIAEGIVDIDPCSARHQGASPAGRAEASRGRARRRRRAPGPRRGRPGRRRRRRETSVAFPGADRRSLGRGARCALG